MGESITTVAPWEVQDALPEVQPTTPFDEVIEGIEKELRTRAKNGDQVSVRPVRLRITEAKSKKGNLYPQSRISFARPQDIEAIENEIPAAAEAYAEAWMAATPEQRARFEERDGYEADEAGTERQQAAAAGLARAERVARNMQWRVHISTFFWVSDGFEVERLAEVLAPVKFKDAVKFLYKVAVDKKTGELSPRYNQTHKETRLGDADLVATLEFKEQNGREYVNISGLQRMDNPEIAWAPQPPNGASTAPEEEVPLY